MEDRLEELMRKRCEKKLVDLRPVMSSDIVNNVRAIPTVR